MNIKDYLDSTYLKTAEQAGVSEKETNQIIHDFVQEAIEEKYKLVMLRPDNVAFAKKQIEKAQSKVCIGTVIGFPEGTSSIEEKISEAIQAIKDGVDELDFVINFEAFKLGDIDLVKQEVLQGTKLAVTHHKKIKWIIEIAALNGAQIIQLTSLIKNVVVANFTEKDFEHVFIKSSTGFYQTADGSPNGATIAAIIAMLENAFPLQVKASGGIKTKEEAIEMIKLGVKRIGTSAAKSISDGILISEKY
ncbi:deoxyribose-phosphate aldolase [Flavobacterium sp.]|jgi:deoxyribose-phosphate aldolase|uniref:deoxyribose-phosphate aldolase n=1 Tax=Flavobacterium sp. TaxID=239 RepID=UPI0037C04C4B